MITKRIGNVVIQDFRPDTDVVVVTIGGVSVRAASNGEDFRLEVVRELDSSDDDEVLFAAVVNNYDPDNLDGEGRVCEECGEPITEDPAGSAGVWVHDTDDGHDRDENHVARPDMT